MKSIKTKLIAAIALLILVSFSISGYFLIQQKTVELSEDLYRNALSFAELTNDNLVFDFENFYLTDSFLHFKKSVASVFTKNADVDGISILNKQATILYDSSQEAEKQYQGNVRKSDLDLERLRDIKPSLLFEDGTVVYLQKNNAGTWDFVNSNEDTVSVDLTKEITNIVFPHKDFRYSLRYDLTYENLRARIVATVTNILILIGVSVFFAILVSVYLAAKLTKPIQTLEAGALRIKKGSLGGQVPVTTDDEIGRLTQTFNSMSKQLKKNTEDLVEKEKLDTEIGLAGEIQRELLPSAAPKVKGLEIAASIKSAEDVGGDMYDFLQPNESNTYIMIADVTGHGVPAGLISAITSSLIMAYSQIHQKTNEILVALSAILHAKTRPNMFATGLLMRWDSSIGAMTFTSAGHDQIVHYEQSKKQVSLKNKGGIALGMVSDVSKQLKEERMNMQKGDYAVIYTDGIPEAWKSEKENLGMNRFLRIVETVGKKAKSAQDMHDGILKEVTKFMGSYPQQDDITIVVMKRV